MLKTGNAFCSPSENLPAFAIILYVMAFTLSGMSNFQSTSIFLPASTLKFLSAFSFFAKTVCMGFIVMASKSSRRAVPLNFSFEILLIFTGKIIWSPCRKKRGSLGSTIKSFWVSNSFSTKPYFRSFVCAKPIIFHLVNDSGIVNFITIFPLVSVCKSG